jgi:hypothetical protein
LATSGAGKVNSAEITLSAINAVCNTIQVVGLAWIGAMVARPQRTRDRET